jgi:hypothetical protein
MTEIPFYLFPLIFIVALLYAAVGHGGASGYLALMGLVGISLNASKPIALILNCVVAAIAFIQYYRSGFFNLKLFVLLAIASIPCAYLGSILTIDDYFYKKILGIILLISSIRFLFPSSDNELVEKPAEFLLLLIGGIIGFISGLIGIGGGILLTPLLLLFRWSNMKTAACVSALFIFVNSLSGLIGQFQKGVQIQPNMFIIILVASMGGVIGSFYGARKWNVVLLRRVLSVVLIIASLKLIFI